MSRLHSKLHKYKPADEAAILSISPRWRGCFRAALEGDKRAIIQLARQIARWEEESLDLSFRKNPDTSGQ
jgi:hypothetical protein